MTGRIKKVNKKQKQFQSYIRPKYMGANYTDRTLTQIHETTSDAQTQLLFSEKVREKS